MIKKNSKNVFSRNSFVHQFQMSLIHVKNNKFMSNETCRFKNDPSLERQDQEHRYMNLWSKFMDSQS